MMITEFGPWKVGETF